MRVGIFPLRCAVLGLALAALAACSAPPSSREEWAYAPPAVTPYEGKPRLREQYLKAHHAGWNFVVESVPGEDFRKVLEGESESMGGSSTTCCEATRNVTRGWYRGAEDGREFLRRLSKSQERPSAVLARFFRLKADILDHPVEDWYILNGHAPDKLVDVEEQGGAVIRTYRDSTRTLLYSVRQVTGGNTHGRREEYDANGVLSEVSTWVEGVREGLTTIYDDNGAVDGREFYHLGKLEGRGVWFDDDGRMKMFVEYSEGQFHGRLIEWDAEGRLTRFSRFENGKVHGRSLYYSVGKAWVTEYDHGDEKVKSGDPLSVSELPTDEQPETLNRLREEIRR